MISRRMLAGVLLVASAVACAGKEPERKDSDEDDERDVAATPSAQSGEQLYQRCITCHQLNGQGTAGTFPPLAGSEYAAAANAAVPINILLRGIQGPITVKGAQYNGLMPAYGLGIEMSDEEVAAVLTYVRSSWGNNASAVTPQEVAAVRAAKAGAGAVTAEELKALM